MSAVDYLLREFRTTRDLSFLFAAVRDAPDDPAIRVTLVEMAEEDLCFYDLEPREGCGGFVFESEEIARRRLIYKVDEGVRSKAMTINDAVSTAIEDLFLSDGDDDGWQRAFHRIRKGFGRWKKQLSEQPGSAEAGSPLPPRPRVRRTRGPRRL